MTKKQKEKLQIIINWTLVEVAIGSAILITFCL